MRETVLTQNFIKNYQVSSQTCK